MNSMSRLPITVLFQYLLYACVIAAEGAIHVRGRVVDESGNNVPGARLMLVQSLASVATDDQGKFDLTSESPGVIHQVPIKISKRLSVVENGAVLTLRGEALRGSHVRIFNLRGRIIAELQCSFTQTTAIFPSLHAANGVYWVTVRNATDIAMIRFFSTGTIQGKTVKIDPFFSTHTVQSGGDSLYCIKLGYLPLSLAVRETDTELVITLNKKWISSDVHSHTVLSGGTYTPDTVFAHAFSYLDCVANADHGGSFSSDTNGNYYQPDSLTPYWRWRSLLEQSWPKIVHQRKVFPDKLLLQGVEWNCPSHDHASVGFILDAQQPAAISNFEYMFDQGDTDTSKADTLQKRNVTHADAVAAVSWMQINYPRSCYCIVNHPSRQLMYTIQDLRDFNNAGPDVAFGFEGMPGHQKQYARGSYDGFAGTDLEAKARTYGGADYMAARVGGLWDALLGEGRRFFVFVNSDFHDHSSTEDFWPGEYGKIWVASPSTDAKPWLAGMRGGAVFAVHGDLIDRLDFMIDDGVKAAAMGGSLSTRNDTVSLSIRYRSPATNNHGDTPVVDHIDLIAGEITGMIAPSNPAYSVDTNPTVAVIKTLAASEFKSDGDWKEAGFIVALNGRNKFFRLRGTNLAASVKGETDAEGNPLADTLGNTEAIAWSDLWFYSNPIFVYKK
jgi:hypothetical protein